MKVAVISDSHNKHENITFDSASDMIIHCGDFSHSQSQVYSFCEWYASLDFKYKIIVAGNHDSYIEEIGYKEFFEYCEEKGIIYLQDTSITIEGVKIHGSPWSNNYGNWSFMDTDLALDKYWQMIPDDVNVLITHGPAYGIGDDVGAYQDITYTNVGSQTLALTINKRLHNLTHHFFGHIHEDFGLHQQEKYIAYNASIFNYYRPILNKHYTFEI